LNIAIKYHAAPRPAAHLTLQAFSIVVASLAEFSNLFTKFV